MQILFDKNHPKCLLEALSLVHKTDYSKSHNVSFYDKKVKESLFKDQVLFLFDYSKKGLEVTNEKYFESGYKIFLFKTNKKEPLNPFKLTLTIIGLWPQVLEIVKENTSPFIYKFKYCGKKLLKVKL